MKAYLSTIYKGALEMASRSGRVTTSSVNKPTLFFVIVLKWLPDLEGLRLVFFSYTLCLLYLKWLPDLEGLRLV
ncbi:MAG: hypothetical protein N2513_09665, partial [Deltaproteobacteria bacterium]|nr:hypothetical protein [Deltaproteobacteria bacterium]